MQHTKVVHGSSKSTTLVTQSIQVALLTCWAEIVNSACSRPIFDFYLGSFWVVSINDLKKTKPRLASRAAPSPRNIAGRDVTMTPKLGYHPTNTKGVPWKKLIWLIWDMTPSCMCDIVCRKFVWSILYYIYAKYDQFNRQNLRHEATKLRT